MRKSLVTVLLTFAMVFGTLGAGVKEASAANVYSCTISAWTGRYDRWLSAYSEASCSEPYGNLYAQTCLMRSNGSAVACSPKQQGGAHWISDMVQRRCSWGGGYYYSKAIISDNYGRVRVANSGASYFSVSC